MTLPFFVSTIEDYAFYKCTELTELTISSYVMLHTIGDYAFCGCTNLVLTISRASPPSIGAYTLYGVRRIRVPSVLLSYYQSATNWSEYASIMEGYEEGY